MTDLTNLSTLNTQLNTLQKFRGDTISYLNRLKDRVNIVKQMTNQYYGATCISKNQNPMNYHSYVE